MRPRAQALVVRRVDNFKRAGEAGFTDFGMQYADTEHVAAGGFQDSISGGRPEECCEWFY